MSRAKMLLQLAGALERAGDSTTTDVLLRLPFTPLPFGTPEPGLVGVDQLLWHHHDLAIPLLDLDQVALFQSKGLPDLLGDRHLEIAGYPHEGHSNFLWYYST